MDLIVIPLKGVGKALFGMSASEVRRHIGGMHEVFKRTKESNPSDHFAGLDIFCYYDDAGLLEAIEFADPARPSVAGHKLLGRGFSAARQILVDLDADAEANARDSVISHKLGVSIWAPYAEDDGPVESLIAFKSGYYN